MRKQLVLVAFLAVGLAVVAGLVAPSAQPRQQSRSLIVGIFDEQATLGDPTWAFPQYKLLGWEPEIDLEEGLRRMLPTMERVRA